LGTKNTFLLSKNFTIKVKIFGLIKILFELAYIMPLNCGNPRFHKSHALAHLSSSTQALKPLK